MKHRTIVHTIENEGRKIEFRISSRVYCGKFPVPVQIGYLKTMDQSHRVPSVSPSLTLPYRFHFPLKKAREIWVKYMASGWKHTNTREVK